jgi:hypothetical protein
MENHTKISLELGINAQRFVQQVMINNATIEESISKGIELALNDISEGDNFVEAIRESTKSELLNIVNRSVMSWEIQSSIQKLIQKKIGEKIESYAEQIAEKITSSLK